MAYYTGRTIGGQGLLGAAENALIAQGWTLVDTIHAGDKVFFSNGVSGKKNLYLRIKNRVAKIRYDGEISPFVVGETVTGTTSGATGFIVATTDYGSDGYISIVDQVGFFENDEAITSATGSATVNGSLQFDENPDPQWLDNQFQTLHFRTYTHWNAAGNTGTLERHQFGPFQIWPQTNDATEARAYDPLVLAPIDLTTGNAPGNTFILPYRNEDEGAAANTTGATFYDGGQKNMFTGMCNHDGYRKVIGPVMHSGYPGPWRFQDMPTRTGREVFNAGYLGSLAGHSPGIQFYSPVDNAQYMLYMLDNGASMRLLNIDTWQEEFISNPATTLSAGLRGAWDGGRYVYAMFGSSTSTFRYDIITKSWTTVAGTAPFAPAGETYSGFSTAIYIPGGTVPLGGLWNEDRMLCILDMYTTALHAYNIRTGTWTTNAIALQVNTWPGSTFLTLSDGRYLLLGGGQDINYYKMDLQNIAAGWTTLSRSIRYQTIQNCPGISIFKPQPAKVQFSAHSQYEYGISADADHIKIWTNPNSKYFWCYAGGYETADDLAMIATAPASPGAAALVSVDSTAGFSVGDAVTVLRPSTGAIFASAIESIPSPTSVSLSLLTSIATDDIIFIDAGDSVLAGDSDLAVCTFDENGTSSVYGYNSLIIDTESSSARFRGTSKKFAARKVALTWPFEGSNRRPYKGSLVGLYNIQDHSDQLDDGSAIQLGDGTKYLVFSPHKRRSVLDYSKIAFGPIG